MKNNFETVLAMGLFMFDDKSWKYVDDCDERKANSFVIVRKLFVKWMRPVRFC